jgi:hypothetical protein
VGRVRPSVFRGVVLVVRVDFLDRPPGYCRPSAPGITGCLSPLLLELRFRVALSWGLFLRLVGLL